MITSLIEDRSCQYCVKILHFRCPFLDHDMCPNIYVDLDGWEVSTLAQFSRITCEFLESKIMAYMTYCKWCKFGGQHKYSGHCWVLDYSSNITVPTNDKRFKPRSISSLYHCLSLSSDLRSLNKAAASRMRLNSMQNACTSMKMSWNDRNVI